MIDRLTKKSRKEGLPAGVFELGAGAGAVDCCRLFSMVVLKEGEKDGQTQRGQKNEQTTRPARPVATFGSARG